MCISVRFAQFYCIKSKYRSEIITTKKLGKIGSQTNIGPLTLPSSLAAYIRKSKNR